MKHTMPELPYAMEALAPKMSRETLEYHYGRHLKTYVDNLNRLITGTPYEELPLDEIVRTADGALFNNAAQAWNHEFFFRMLTPDPSPMPAGLAERLARDFGSVEEFRAKFTQAAVGLFGSGWVWLVADRSGRLSILARSNAGNPLTEGLRPVLTIDVWGLVDWRKVADLCIPKRYACTACDYVYDPEKGDPETGIAPGTPFEEIPDDWTCPVCGLYKDAFRAVGE